MLEKMDSLVARASGTLAPSQGQACSEPRELTTEDIRRILADASRTQGRWGTSWDIDRNEGPAPTMDAIVEKRLPELNLTSADADRLLSATRRAQAQIDERQRKVCLREFNQTVGQRFASATLENYEVSCPEQRKAIDALRAYTANIRERAKAGDGIVLFGSAGSGKTHILCAVAKAAIHAGLTVGWSNGQDLFGRFRESMDGGDSESEIIRGLVGPDVLVLDDVLPPGGALTDYQASTIYRIVDSRYRACRPTWASINVGDGSEAERGMGAQVVDRLRHGALCIYCNWPSYRKADCDG